MMLIQYEVWVTDCSVVENMTTNDLTIGEDRILFFMMKGCSLDPVFRNGESGFVLRPPGYESFYQPVSTSDVLELVMKGLIKREFDVYLGRSVWMLTEKGEQVNDVRKGRYIL